MEWLTAIGTFLGGIGLLFISFGIFMRSAIYAKLHKDEIKDK